MLEAMGLSSKADRFDRTDGSTAPRNMMNNGNDSSAGLASDNEFNRLEQFAKVQAPPPVKFKDLRKSSVRESCATRFRSITITIF